MICVHKQNILFVVNTSGDELLPSKWTLIMHLILYDDYYMIDWTIIRLIAKLIPKSIDFTKQRFDDINFTGKTFLDFWLR